MKLYRRELKNGFDQLDAAGSRADQTAVADSAGRRPAGTAEPGDSGLNKWQQTAERWILSYPVVSVGLAITAGVLAGWAIKRR